MSRLIRRLYSTSTNSTPSSSSASSSASSASSIAASFLSRTTSAPPAKHTQFLDPNQLARLHATLNRVHDSSAGVATSASSSSSPTPSSPSPSTSSPKESTPLNDIIPPCHHLIYFTPSHTESTLGPDGTDKSYNPAAPFTRRMWAGGSLVWERNNPLRVGQTVTETTKVVSAVAKMTKAGEQMVVVGVEKRFENERGVSLVDRRNWIFRPEITTPLPLAPLPPLVPYPPTSDGTHVRDFLQTPVSLFRFSALTFNAHKIHYNREWCREVEGHRDLVVHGPLNLINIVDFWRGISTAGQEGPRSVEYRATSPLYAGEGYRIFMGQEVEGVTEARILDGFGRVGMVARILRH